jgi:hypothetical protein
MFAVLAFLLTRVAMMARPTIATATVTTLETICSPISKLLSKTL